MVSELERYVKKKEIYKTSGGFRGQFIRTIFYYFFSCSHGGICRSHVEIEFGKNFKVKHIHGH